MICFLKTLYSCVVKSAVVLDNTFDASCAGVYRSKTNARQENQSTQCVTIWMVMSKSYRMNAQIRMWIAMLKH